MFRPRRLNSTDARKHFTRIIDSVQFSSRCYVVESYHNPIVRIINEHYIQVLEEVLGKKTVNQVMQITGDDRLLEAEKMEQIKKIFQRRLSGSQRPERAKRVEGPAQPKPQPKSPAPAPHTQNPKPNPSPKPKNPTSKNREVLLLSNGKNYQ